MLTIKTTGVEDYLDGSANIKALIIGGPGAGKTRFSSYWPKPIFLDCENGRGSLADRNMPYAEIKSSTDMLDALEYLKGLQRTPKAQRQFQTVVVDTVDSFQRLVKEEWVTANKAQTFTGFDAWGYLDTKMQLLLTRLLNLDYNVVTLSHFEVTTFKEGDATVRELKVQLQGKISEQIFNDFGLVGWLGTYWAAGENGRIQKRGLTFQPTPDRPFLKDRFNATPPMIDIAFDDSDYQQLFQAFFERPEFEAFTESAVVGEIPSAPITGNGGAISQPAEGGPTATPLRLLPGGASDAEVPLEKKLKGELEKIATDLGVSFKGNTLKGELITAIRDKQAQVKAAQPNPSASDAGGSSLSADPTPARESSDPVDPWSPPSSGSPTPATSSGSPSSAASATSTAAASEAAPPAAGGGSSSTALADAVAAEGPARTVLDQMTPEQVITAMGGGEVISREPADTPVTSQPAAPSATSSASSAQQGPSACADCGADLTADWQDPQKKNAMRMGFIKHRKYLCSAHQN